MLSSRSRPANGVQVKVSIINVTGCSIIELARILSRHPEAELVSVTG